MAIVGNQEGEKIGRFPFDNKHHESILYNKRNSKNTLMEKRKCSVSVPHFLVAGPKKNSNCNSLSLSFFSENNVTFSSLLTLRTQ